MPKLPWKIIGVIVAALCLVTAVILLGMLINGRGKDQVRAVEAETGKVVAQGDSRASAAATTATADYGDRQLGRVTIDQENRHAIKSQPHATDAVDPDLHDAGLRSLCRRTAYSSSEQCSRLR